MTHALAAPRLHPHADAPLATEAAALLRAVADRTAFGLLCLLTGTGPSALRRQFDGPWDAAFAERAA